MKGLKQRGLSFLRTVWKSLSDIRFYRGIRHKRAGEAVSYLAALASIVWLVPFLVVFFIGARETLSGFLTVFDRGIPAGTSFEMKKGVFSNTLAAPAVLDWGGLQVVINTSTSTASVAPGQDGIAVMRESLVSPAQGDAPAEVIPFSKLPDFSTSKEQFQERFRAAAPWVIAALALLGLCLFAVISAFVIAAATLLHAFFLWLLMRGLKKPLRYAEAWVLAAYALTPFLLAKAVLAAAGIADAGVSSVLYWILLGFIAYDLWKGE